jgi:hypothetical protein
MKRRILLLLALFLSQTAFALAQETGEAVDVAAIRQVVQYYFEGWKNDDANIMKKAFHPKAKFFGISDENDLKETSQAEVHNALKENIRRGVPKVNASLKIISIDVAGTAASVKIEIEYPGNYQSARSTEFLSLIKFPKDGWKFVSKVSAIEQKQSTR